MGTSQPASRAGRAARSSRASNGWRELVRACGFDCWFRLVNFDDSYAADIEEDNHWTIPRAESYYRSLPPRAKRILQEAVSRDG